MKWKKNDGGRKEAGYKGKAGDCGVRAISIATGKEYQEVYDRLTELKKKYIKNRNTKKAKWYREKKSRCKTARYGMPKDVFEEYLIEELGWKWEPTIKIGSGCQVHLREGELPEEGIIIARLSGHFCAIIDGVIQDTYDPSRGGTRCVYGYWFNKNN